jgi:hypothetical protein
MNEWVHDIVMTRMFSGGEWPTVLLFLGMGAIFFLAPMVGYTLHSRFRIGMGMWLLVIKVGLGLLQHTLIGVQALGHTNVRWGDPSSAVMTVQLLFPVLEMAFFLMAMVMFVFGLQSLTKRTEVVPPPERE